MNAEQAKQVILNARNAGFSTSEFYNAAKRFANAGLSLKRGIEGIRRFIQGDSIFLNNGLDLFRPEIPGAEAAR